jgi:hydroxypyruvate isomerase
LAVIAKAAARNGVTVVLETLNSYDSPRFPLTSLARTEAVLAAARREAGDNLGLLFDVYHLHRMDHHVAESVLSACQPISHVQLADSPGRGRPGTGTIEFDAILDALRTSGYAGYIGLEYEPSPGVFDSLPDSLATHAA